VPRPHLLDGAADRRRVGHVERDRRDVAARIPQLGGRRLAMLAAARAEHDDVAEPGQSRRDLAADPLVATRDESDHAFLLLVLAGPIPTLRPAWTPDRGPGITWSALPML
jgi:hypothetical protein